MKEILRKTFGGLTLQYYLRQLLFGILMAILMVFLFSGGFKNIDIKMILFATVSTLLYPYSRFVYESIVGFIMGNNMIFSNIILYFTVKFFTMYLCWGFAIFIAPLGLAYLYYYHSKKQI